MAISDVEKCLRRTQYTLLRENLFFVNFRYILGASPQTPILFSNPYFFFNLGPCFSNFQAKLEKFLEIILKIPLKSSKIA